MNGTLMIVGPPDVGKSTLSRYLFKKVGAQDARVAYLDGDPGQSTLGPPGTMTLAMAETGDESFPPRGQMWRSFVGSVSPAGHMLPVVTCAARLIGAAQETGVHVIIYDTTGLVDPARGGIYLKLAKIDLLRPTVMFSMQRDQELESLLVALRRSRRIKVVELPFLPGVQSRDQSMRKAHRAAQFADYFSRGSHLRVNWTQFAVLPAPHFTLHRLVALEDVAGFTIGLGIVVENDRLHRQITVHTPVAGLSGVDVIRLGDLAVNPLTFEDRALSRKN
jgi:polynucleotide 5'-hydroxyl-kinase GRC3/NOL9